MGEVSPFLLSLGSEGEKSAEEVSFGAAMVITLLELNLGLIESLYGDLYIKGRDVSLHLRFSRQHPIT